MMRAVELDLPWLQEHRRLIEPIAESFELSPAVVAGIMSRESGGGRLLGKGDCPPLTGDRGHGRGLMQIDDRWHKHFIKIGDFWTYHPANIAYGCYLLSKNLKAAERRLKGFNSDELLRVALAAYNCGPGRAIKAARTGMDVDAYTTGGDYSSDVLERARFLRERGWKDEQPVKAERAYA